MISTETINKMQICSAACVDLGAFWQLAGPLAAEGEHLFPVLTRRSDDSCHSLSIKYKEKQNNERVSIS